MNADTIDEVVVVTDVPTTNYWLGFNCYCKRVRLEALDSEDARKGWMFANKCEGAALVEALTRDYEDNIEDRDWWSRGEW